jgi:hypothetical protein
MAPAVQLSPATFARLQKFAEPLVDDIESVINRLADSYEDKQGNGALAATAKDFSGGATPNLTHTKVMSAEVGGKPLKKAEANWNGILDHVVTYAAAKLNDLEALKELVIINYVVGEKTDQGYRYLPSAGISVQGQDANSAWKATSHIAKALHLPAKVMFMWYDNEKAVHPGQTGKLAVNA